VTGYVQPKKLASYLFLNIHVLRPLLEQCGSPPTISKAPCLESRSSYQSSFGGDEMIDFQTNPDQIEELKTGALMIGISLFSFLALLVVAAVLLTRWSMS